MAQVRALLPPGYRDQDRISFPGLLELPTAPGMQTVTDRWRVDWASYLVSRRGWVVLRADVRGAAGAGDAARAAVQGKLGQLEMKDLLAVLR